MSLEKRYKAVINRINNPNVELLAVSKKQPLEKIKYLYQLGQRKFGESYVQEAIDKIQKLSEFDIQWHFIGPIQSNKTKHLAQYFDWVQSVDSLKLITRLNRQRSDQKNKLNVLLQLKVGGEDRKRGLDTDELLSICKKHQEFNNVVIRGLMCIPAPTSNYSVQMAQFKICKDVFEQMKSILPIDILSMGMSGDLEAAIESGSTMVRIGTDLFGQRKY
jgi:hypothetical protein